LEYWEVKNEEQEKTMKSKTIALLCASFAVLVCTQASFSKPPDQSDSRVQIGFSIAPVPLNLVRKNRALVGLGSYLVNAVGGCNDCHTHPNYAPGGDPYLGETEVINTAEYLAGGREFGPFTSANITPDEYGRPAGLTFEEFEHLLRTGEDPDVPGMLLQVMPWTIYGNMSQHDLRAIYEYLSSIPSLPDNPNPGP
jgi:hypothetical protein